MEEIVDLPEGGGPYGIYLLEKRGIDTLTLLGAVASALGMPPSRIKVPALKDKRAVALQYLSVGPRERFPKTLKGKGFRGVLVGLSPRHLSPKDLVGNRFLVTLREVELERGEALREAFEKVLREGFPNYFDFQRFGSFSPQEGFPGKALLKGEWERVLKFYLLWPLLGDPSKVRRLKEGATAHWGQWDRLKGLWPRSNQRSVLSFLCEHPEDFKKAVDLINPRVLSLWLSAYQGYLWNEVASRIFRRRSQEGYALRFPFQELWMPKAPPQGISGFRLPLFSARSLPEGEALELLLEVLEREGLSLKDLKARALSKAYLPRGERPLWVVPKDGQWLSEEEDDLFPGHKKVLLSFTLPPGSYGTMFLKTVALGAGSGLVVGGEQVPTGLNRVEDLSRGLDEDG